MLTTLGTLAIPLLSWRVKTQPSGQHIESQPEPVAWRVRQVPHAQVALGSRDGGMAEG